MKSIEEWLQPRQPNESELDYEIRKIDASIIMNNKLIEFMKTFDPNASIDILQDIIDNQLEKRLKLTNSHRPKHL